MLVSENNARLKSQSSQYSCSWAESNGPVPRIREAGFDYLCRDMQVIRKLPGTGFCGPWNSGNQRVYFYVKNTGSTVAPASVVQVNFGGNNYSTLMVPSLAPNQQTLRNKAIPLARVGFLLSFSR